MTLNVSVSLFDGYCSRLLGKEGCFAVSRRLFAALFRKIEQCERQPVCSGALRVVGRWLALRWCCFVHHKWLLWSVWTGDRQGCCETGIPPDLAGNEALPVPLSVLTWMLCHAARWGLLPGSCSHRPATLSSILSCQYEKNNKPLFLCAFSLVDVFVAQQAEAGIPLCQTQKERGENTPYEQVSFT